MSFIIYLIMDKFVMFKIIQVIVAATVKSMVAASHRGSVIEIGFDPEQRISVYVLGLQQFSYVFN